MATRLEWKSKRPPKVRDPIRDITGDAERGVWARCRQATSENLPEPWQSKPELTTQEILIWMMLRKAMQSAGDNARKEVFDRIEGRPTLKITGPAGGPIETVTYDLKKLSAEKIRLMREILAEAAVGKGEAVTWMAR